MKRVTINIQRTTMTHRFDEGVKEILMSLFSIGATVYHADQIDELLRNRPEPIEQKVAAIKQAEKIINTHSFSIVADEILDNLETPDIDDFEDSSPSIDVIQIAMDRIMPSEIHGSDIYNKANNKLLKPHQDYKGLWTIGIGHLIGKGTQADRDAFVNKRLKEGKGEALSHNEALELFKYEVTTHYNIVERVFKDIWQDITPELKAALVDISYRGDLKSKATGKLLKFTEYLKNKNWELAAKEYLNHKEYKSRAAKGTDSITKRMESNAMSMRSQK